MTGTKEQIIKWLSYQPEGQYTIETAKEKRNKDQNAFYWTVVGLISKSVGVSVARVHNELLRRNPVFEMVEGKRVTLLIADTDETASKIVNSPTHHLFPTQQCKMGKDGIMYRYWWMLKGSHEMSKEEFSKLLDEALSECRDLGVRVPEYER